MVDILIKKRGGGVNEYAKALKSIVYCPYYSENVLPLDVCCSRNGVAVINGSIFSLCLAVVLMFRNVAFGLSITN